MAARLCGLCFTELEPGEVNICSFCAVAKLNVDSEETRLAEWARIYLGGVLIDVSQRIGRGATYLREIDPDDPNRTAADRRMAALVRSQGTLLELIGESVLPEEILIEEELSQTNVDEAERHETAPVDPRGHRDVLKPAVGPSDRSEDACRWPRRAPQAPRAPTWPLATEWPRPT